MKSLSQLLVYIAISSIAYGSEGSLDETPVVSPVSVVRRRYIVTEAQRKQKLYQTFEVEDAWDQTPIDQRKECEKPISYQFWRGLSFSSTKKNRKQVVPINDLLTPAILQTTEQSSAVGSAAQRQIVVQNSFMTQYDQLVQATIKSRQPRGCLSFLYSARSIQPLKLNDSSGALNNSPDNSQAVEELKINDPDFLKKLHQRAQKDGEKATNAHNFRVAQQLGLI